MLGLGARIFAIAAALALMSLPAGAAKRLALVIGNSAYSQAPKLSNPRNDAADTAAALREIGFEVIERLDLDASGMIDAVSEFSRQLSGADMALFYYAGHGLQFSGRNHLVPVDAKIAGPTDVKLRTVDLSSVIEEMERQTPVNLIFLDACRDNPLANALADATRSAASRGLARADIGVGTLIAFSTAPEKTALDGSGRNSPFTAALLKHLRTPGLEVRQMLSRVRAEVVAATDRRQIPWDNSSLMGDVYFVPPVVAVGPNPSKTEDRRPAEVVALPPLAEPKPAPTDTELDADAAYQEALVKNTPEAYEALLRKFPSHPRREAVRKLIGRAYDQRMWETVRRQDTIAAYEQYKLAFSDGMFARDATQRIASLRAAQQEDEVSQPQVRPPPPDTVAVRPRPPSPPPDIVAVRPPPPPEFEPVRRPPQRRAEIHSGVDLFGGDYNVIKEVDLQSCESACTSDRQCRAFTYNRRARWCFLKQSVGQRTEHEDAVSGIVQGAQGAAQAPSGPAPRTARRIERRSGLDLAGSDYRILKEVAIESCESTCLGDRQCRAFTYNVRARWCFLKQSIGRTTSHKDAVSGFVQADGVDLEATASVKRSRGLDIFPETDFPGNDYRNLRPATLESCRDACAAEGTCRAFAFHREKSWCFLKSGVSRTIRNQQTFGGLKN